MKRKCTLTTNQIAAFDAIKDGEWHRSASVKISVYSPCHRAQINALQSLVKRGYAKQRPTPSKTEAATWQITEAGRIAFALEGRRCRHPP